jgi:peptidoglycan/LPS O-acetylase OafA/YrhL
MRKHFKELDGIRGVAALMVMWLHYFSSDTLLRTSRLVSTISRFASIGQTGVDLFFVLSGFLITRILLVAQAEPRYFRNFYAKRALRILPLYYFFLFIFLFVQPYLVGQKPHSFSSYWWWLVYLQNIPPAFGLTAYGPNHYWSLAVEEQFYLVWPLLVLLLSRRALVVTCVLLIPAALILRVFLLEAGVDVFYFTLTRLDALSLGSLLALLEPSILEHRALSMKRFLYGLSATLAPLVPLYLIFSKSHAIWLESVKYPLIGTFYFCFLGFAITMPRDFLVCRILTSAPMCFFGRISFGLYVYHEFCFFWVGHFLANWDPLVLLPIAFGAATLIAYVSFRVIESPFLELKGHFSSPRIV